jgi:hypothetical protein
MGFLFMRTSRTRLLGSASRRLVLVLMRTSKRRCAPIGQTRFPSTSSGLRLTGSASLRLACGSPQDQFVSGSRRTGVDGDEACTIGALLEYVGGLIWAEYERGRGQDVAEQNYRG